MYGICLRLSVQKTLPSFGAGLNSLRDLSQIYVTSASLYLYFKTPKKIQEASMILSTVMERGMKAVLLFYCLASGKKQKLTCILTSTKSRTWLVSLF